jgi:hypothetical protein
MTRCIGPLSKAPSLLFPPQKGETAIAWLRSSPRCALPTRGWVARSEGRRRGGATGAGQRSFGAGSCAQRVMPEPMTAMHLLMKLLANPLMRLLAIPLSNQKTVAKWLVISRQAGKWLVITQSAGFAITSDPFALSEVLP